MFYYIVFNIHNYLLIQLLIYSLFLNYLLVYLFLHFQIILFLNYDDSILFQILFRNLLFLLLFLHEFTRHHLLHFQKFPQREYFIKCLNFIHLHTNLYQHIIWYNPNTNLLQELFYLFSLKDYYNMAQYLCIADRISSIAYYLHLCAQYDNINAFICKPLRFLSQSLSAWLLKL